MNSEREKSSIRFPQYPLSMDDMYLISDELISNNCWTTIYMWKTFLEKKYLAVLLSAIKLNPIVICLSLDWNRLGDDGAALLSSFLQTNTSLRGIYLNGNNISAIGAQALADALNLNTTLTYLELSSNPLGDDGIIALSRVLQKNRTLQALNLNQTSMTHNSLQHLADALEINESLKILYLNNNLLGDKGILIIAGALARNSTLSTLDLSKNNITEIGANAIEYALKQKETALVNLFLNDNPIRDLGVKSIVSALHINKTSKKLKLESTDMTIDGACAIAHIIRMNYHLVNLALSRNPLGDALIHLLVDAFKANDTLQHLYLNAINLTDDCIPNLMAILKKKTLNSIELVKNQFTDKAKLTLEQASKLNPTYSLYFQFSFEEKDHC
ncbi:unnamed protein product [Rotaria sp. Silwood2]|nr:unnamed protein product [Rotaria sp. Silwood2]CAF4352320.1 unnamed protein product [Rotaria sp. Silwood2]